MRTLVVISMFSAAVALAACESKPNAGAPAGGSAGSSNKGDQARPHGEKDDHGQEGGERDAHGGPVVELGTSKAGGMNVKASRDAGEIKPGGEAAIDVWIDGGLGNAAVVRLWIGTEDAKGSLKAKAEIEDGKWHTHAEVPKPLPADSKLWVEIEGKDGTKTAVSFDLKK